jgi:hypothetical protein
MKIGEGIKIGPGIRLTSIPTIISENLIINLDAKSYSGSGITWPALTGSDATLVNTPTYTASAPTYFTFDKTSYEYATIPNIGDQNIWTLECWLRLNSSLTGQITSVICNQFDLVNKLNFSMGTNNAPGSYNLVVGFFDGNGWHNTTGFAPNTNTWYHVVGTYNGTVVKQYLNSSFNTQLNYTGTPQSGGEVRIARRWDSSSTDPINYFPGDIGELRIYGAALTEVEVLRNYNATKARYGL